MTDRVGPFGLSCLLLSVALLSGCGNGATPTPGASGSAAGGPGAGATASAGASSSASASSSADGASGGGASASASSGAGGTSSAGTGTGSGGLSSGSSVLALQQDFVSIVQRVNPSVVVIQTSSGLGSGVVFDGQGDIVTNAHVAGTSTTFSVTSIDGRTVAGKLVGTFPPDDVAVIRVSAGGLRPATFGDSSKLAIGDLVLAIGNPLGLQSSVTEGIVSATGRVVSEPGGASIPNMIQTSAAINPGNSGGALVDLAGNVVGIPTLAATDPQLGGSAAGIGFAVSSSMAADIARQLIRYGHVVDSHRAFLGVQLADAQQAQGALVVALTPGGPATKAGIAAGDLIVSVNGQATPSSGALSDLLATLQPGQTVSVGIVDQSGAQRTVRVTLGRYPGQG